MTMSKSLRAKDVLKLETFLPYGLSVLTHQMATRFSRLYEKFGLTTSQWRVLVAIAEEPGRTAQAVVEMTPMDKGIVSRSVKGLVHDNLLRREAAREDGRMSHLHLTAKGEEIYDRVLPEIRRLEARLLEGFTQAEQAKLLEKVTRLRENLAAMGEDHKAAATAIMAGGSSVMMQSTPKA